MKLHSKELLYGLSEFYKIFGDQTRLRILDALLNKPLCVNQISEILDVTPSAISHQLKNLRSSNLVKGEKNGKARLVRRSARRLRRRFRRNGGLSSVRRISVLNGRLCEF